MHDPQKKHRLGTVNEIILRPISSLIGAHSAYMIVCTYERLVNMVLGETLLFALWVTMHAFGHIPFFFNQPFKKNQEFR